MDDGNELTVRHVETEVREGKVNLNYVKNRVEGLNPVVRKKRTSKIGNSVTNCTLSTILYHTHSLSIYVRQIDTK